MAAGQRKETIREIGWDLFVCFLAHAGGNLLLPAEEILAIIVISRQ